MKKSYAKEKDNIIEIIDEKQFQIIQNKGAGYILITDIATGNKIHLPFCTCVTSKNFFEKVIINKCENGQYYWLSHYNLGKVPFKIVPCSVCRPYKKM